MDDIPDVMNEPEQCDETISLEKLCLNFIVREFERFCFAFTVSEDETLQQNFKALQRRFSVKLAKSLHEDSYLREEYFGLLINEHLDFLDGEWLEYLDFLDSKWLENCCYLNPMENISCLKNLTQICFRYCGKDEVLENVAKFCPKIIEIDVRNSDVTDNGVKYLCKTKNGTVPCPEIRNILIEKSCITDIGAKCLIRKLPLLEKIDYQNVPVLIHSIYEENAPTFQNVHSYNIVKIDLLGFQNLPYYTEVLKTCLNVCPKLKSIACPITEKKQLDLFSNIHLKKLYFIMWDISPKINLDSFVKMNGCNLTSLHIKNCKISISVLGKHCRVLKEFIIHDVNFTDEDDKIEIIFPCLNVCYFSKTRPSDTKGFCLLLSSSPKLESVSLFNCKLSLEMKNQILRLCKNPCMKKFEFDQLQLEMKFVRDILLSCPSLKEMCLNDCFFDVDETKIIVYILSKSLPNKPFIFFMRSTLFLSSMSLSEYLITYPEYLKEYPEEVYKSSSLYDSLYSEIALKWND